MRQIQKLHRLLRAQWLKQRIIRDHRRTIHQEMPSRVQTQICQRFKDRQADVNAPYMRYRGQFEQRR